MNICTSIGCRNYCKDGSMCPEHTSRYNKVKQVCCQRKQRQRRRHKRKYDLLRLAYIKLVQERRQREL